MPKLIQASEPAAARRRLCFHLVGTDGMTPATSEAGGQPQISSNGGAWTNTGIGVLAAIGNGRYYADLTIGAVATVGTWLESRYKSATTAECPGDSAFVVEYDPTESLDPDVWTDSRAAKLDRLGSGQINSTSLVQTGGAFTITKGMDYNAADGYAFEWNDTSNRWPPLTGAGITLEAINSSYVKTGSVTVATGTHKQVIVEYNQAESSALSDGDFPFRLVATLTSGRRLELVNNVCTVRS